MAIIITLIRRRRRASERVWNRRRSLYNNNIGGSGGGVRKLIFSFIFRGGHRRRRRAVVGGGGGGGGVRHPLDGTTSTPTDRPRPPLTRPSVAAAGSADTVVARKRRARRHRHRRAVPRPSASSVVRACLPVGRRRRRSISLLPSAHLLHAARPARRPVRAFPPPRCQCAGAAHALSRPNVGGGRRVANAHTRQRRRAAHTGVPAHRTAVSLATPLPNESSCTSRARVQFVFIF